MEIEKRQRGRPRKKENSIKSWRFMRAAMAMCAYDEARKRGDKHSVAVRNAVDFVKQRNPKMPISETEVKRTLAALRPRSSRTILRFERLVLSEEDLKMKRWMREQLATSQEKKGITLLAPPNYHQARSVTAFQIRFDERPNYPRHNRKNPKE